MDRESIIHDRVKDALGGVAVAEKRREDGAGAQKMVIGRTDPPGIGIGDEAGAVIDTAVEAGANIIDYVSFESSSMKEAYEKALREAVADAKQGRAKKKDSFCTPPLSVMTIRAFFSRTMMSKKEAGGMTLTKGDVERRS